MLVKGIIKTIDFTGNTCTVRIPTFESHRADQYIVTAAISNQPGLYNGYKEEDVVWIGFDTDQYNQPVVLGKLYLGAAKEKEDPRGTVNAETAIASTSASIPFDTVLSNGVDPSVPNTQANYTSLQKLSNQVNESTQAITKATTDFGNRITQLITDTDNTGAQYKSLIQQTAREIKAEVAQETAERKANDEEIKTTAKAELDIQAGEIKAQVENKVDTESGSISSGFGWSLSKDNWKVFASADVTNMSDEERRALVADADLSIWSNTTYEIRKDEDGNTVKDKEGNIIVDAVVSDYFYINGVRTNISTKDEDLGYIDTPLTVNDLHLELKLVNSVYYWSLVNNKTSKYKVVTDSSGAQFAANTKPVLIAMENGIYVNGSGTFKGTITAEEGHIGKFVIGKENINGVSYLLVPNLSELDFKKGTFYTNGNITSQAEECTVQVWLRSYGTDTGAEIVAYASTDTVVSGDIMIDIEFSYKDFSSKTQQARSQLRLNSGTVSEVVVQDGHSWTEDPAVWLDYIKIDFWTKNFEITNISETKKITSISKYITSEDVVEKQTFTKATTWNSILSKHNYYKLITPAGIYSDGYLDTNGNQITSFNQQPMTTATGVYLGIDGLRLGDTFSVDASGTVTATGLTIDLSNKQVNEIAQLIKQVTLVTVQYGVSNSASTLPSNWYSTAEAANAKVGDYLWKQTITEYNIGSSVVENTVTHIAENGNTISAKNIYILSDSKPSKPTDATTTTEPSIPSGWSETPLQATRSSGEHYCWSCVCTTTYSADISNYQVTYSEVQLFTAYNGILSTTTEYLQTDVNYSDNISEATDWASDRPEAKAGYYIWTKVSTTFVDSTLDTVSYSCDYTPTDGAQGISRNIDLISDAYVVKKTDTGYDPAVINLTTQVSPDACASAYNLTFNVPNYDTDTRTGIKLAEVTKQLESANLFSDNSTSAAISISYDQDGVALTDSLNIMVISDGQDGSAGRGISKIDTYYAVTQIQTAPAETDITSASILPISNTNKYLWQKTVILYTDNTSKTEITLAAAFGDQGIKGVDGVDGEDGKTYYTWLKYADTADGDGLSDNPDGKEYIGFAYNKYTATESTDPKDYSWTLIKGDTGEPGEDGNGIKDLSYKYGLTTFGDHIPTDAEISWLDEMPTLDPVNKYLWQKESIQYTKDTDVQTTITLLAAYGDTGADGKDGASGLALLLTNPTITLRGDSSGVIANQEETTRVLVYYGVTALTANSKESMYYSVGTIKSSIHNITTELEDNQYVIKFKSVQTKDLSGQIEIPIIIHTSATSTTTQSLYLNWTTAQKGEDGKQGQTVSVTTNNIYFYWANARNTWISDEPDCPTLTYNKDSVADVDASGNWTTTVITPTQDKPYVWQCVRTVTTTTVENNTTVSCKDGEPAIYNSMDGLISILTADGIDLIYKNDNDGTYNLRADNLSGAIGDQVNIGGQTTYNKVLYSDTYDANTTYYYKSGKKYIQYTDLTAENFTEKVNSEEGVYTLAFLDGWAIKPATDSTSAAIYSGDVTEFADASDLVDENEVTGVYIGTDGIRLGNNFSVDTSGNVSATGLTINLTDKQKESITQSVIQSSKQYVKTEYSYGKGTATTAPVNWYNTITEVDAKAGDYIWTRSTIYYTTNGVESTEIKDSIEHLSENGDTITTDTIYKLADSMPNRPENSTSTTAPGVPDGWSTVPLQATKESGKHYCYVCEATTTHTKNSDNYVTVYSDVQQFSYYSGIVSTETKYLSTTTNYTSTEIIKVTNGWVTTRPNNASGYYIWTWIKTSYVDASLDTNEYYCDYTATNGVSRNIDLTTTAYVVKKLVSEGTTTYDPAQITLTCALSADAVADKYNLTFEVPNYDTDTRANQTASIQTKTIDSAILFKSGSTTNIKVSYLQDSDITLEDTVNIAVISDGKNGVDGKDGTNGKNGTDGRDGTDGVGISSIDTYYATTTTQNAPQASTITSTTILPIDNTNKYLWQKNIIRYTNNTSKTSITLVAAFGDQGVQGIQGPKGEDGSPQYTWVKYADTPTTGMSNIPNGKKYIGFAYNKSTSEESSAYEDYSWSLIKGDTGEPGEDGNGIKAITYYYGVTSTPDIPEATTITEPDLSKASIDATNKYLWQKEVITYTVTTEPQITTTLLAVYGDKGQDGKDGANGLVVMLTNPTMTLRGDSTGVKAEQKESTEVLVYDGLTRITTDTNQAIYYSLDLENIESEIHTISANIESNQYVITLTSKQTDTLSGKIKIPVEIHYSETNHVTQTLYLNWTTAQKGDTGEPGEDGKQGQTVSVTTTNLYFYYANTSNTWDSSSANLCPTISYDSEKGPNVDANGKWTLTAKTPTSDTPYVWQCIRTVITTTKDDVSTTECSDGDPALYNSLDGLVSILSADGIDIIYKTNNEYGIHADKLSGAIGSSVNIGGDWEIQSAENGKAAAIHTANYTSFNGNSDMKETGIYIGTDGIRCGKNFTVDATGAVVAKSLSITVQTRAYYAVNDSDIRHPTAPNSESLGVWTTDISKATTSLSTPYRWTCTVPLVNNTPDFTNPTYTVASIQTKSAACSFTYDATSNTLTISYYN